MQKDQQKLEQLIKGKKVAFIGAGVSHKTLIKEFVELGAHVTLCDQKKSVEDFGDYAATIRELGIDLSLGENYLDGFKGQDIIMRTPGFVGYFEKPLQDAMAAGTMVTSEVELFFDFCPCPIVAVTGSDGKTTTTTLIAKFFEAAGRKVHLGGNIGAALLPMLPEVSPDDVAVVELSSFQLISMHSSPNVAVVTNVTPNHLDHHKDMQEYIDAKRNILLYQTPPCRAVLGYENEISCSMQKDCKGKQVWFTRLHDTDNGAFLRKDGMLCMAEDGVVTPFLAQKDVKLRGLHNIENLLAAAAAVWGLVPVEAIQQVGSTFTGVEHRIEPVRTLDGVLYYNDSIGTSPTRTIAGLRSFNQKVILIAGGYDKHIPYEPLAPEVIAHVKNLVLMGATGPRIEKAVRECEGFDEAALPIQHADNMQHAVELCAYRLNAPGLGKELGCTLETPRDMYLGFYYAPGVVCEAIKTAIYAQCMLELLGKNPVPRYCDDHNDIVTCFDAGTADALIGFCQGIQAASPVDSYAAPEPSPEPGYTDEVVMASGSFTQGSTIELSCDGPLREPYTCYLQGGLNFAASRAGVLLAIQKAYFKD